MDIVIYTDGACSGNPGRGGWGIVMQAYKNNNLIKEKHISGFAQHTTNNPNGTDRHYQSLKSFDVPLKAYNRFRQ